MSAAGCLYCFFCFLFFFVFGGGVDMCLYLYTIFEDNSRER